ncbi:MAG TPA: (2Fe-2S)-binding protein, partial [Micromonosporaceae bacterium]|nr:(2Fe-2S)-binding protein [Micromonosporaceae bacterium]
MSTDDFDVDDPDLTRFDLVRHGAHLDGVEIVHYAPRFAIPGTKAERRVERTVAMFFLLCGLGATAFVVVFIWWPWKYEQGTNLSKLYTPMLGLTLGLMLAGIGLGVITWAKKLLPVEVAVEKRHVGGSSPVDRRTTGASIAILGDETGIARRPLLKGAVIAGLAPVGLAAIVPLGALVVDPHHPDALYHTGFDPVNNGGKPVRLVREDYSPIRPEDVSIGGQITVYPGIPEGATNTWADSPTL